VKQRSLGDGSPPVGPRNKVPVGSLGDGPRNLKLKREFLPAG